MILIIQAGTRQRTKHTTNLHCRATTKRQLPSCVSDQGCLVTCLYVADSKVKGTPLLTDCGPHLLLTITLIASSRAIASAIKDDWQAACRKIAPFCQDIASAQIVVGRSVKYNPSGRSGIPFRPKTTVRAND